MPNLATGNLLVDYYLQHRIENLSEEAEDYLKQENSELQSDKSQQDWQKVLDKVMQF